MATTIDSELLKTDAALVARQVLVDAWNTGDIGLLDTLLCDDYVRHGRTDESDREHIKETITTSRAAFPDLYTSVEHQVVDGDIVATHWRWVGTHDGAFYDLPITHRKVNIEGMTFTRIRDGKVAEEWESWSSADLFASLGVTNLWEA